MSDAMSQTTTPSGADVLAAVTAEMRARLVNHRKHPSPTLVAWADQIDAAVAALIARNAELEAERDALLDALPELTAERLREVLSYDPATGEFVWTERAYHAVVAEKAGGRNRKGYIQICIDLRRYYAHRLAWLYVHGRWPAEQIDHINGVKDDNRIANLREATNAENQQNRRITRKNTSDHVGVSWHKKTQQWRAQISVNGRPKHLGCFDDIDDADKAYADAKAKLHPFRTAKGNDDG